MKEIKKENKQTSSAVVQWCLNKPEKTDTQKTSEAY